MSAFIVATSVPDAPWRLEADRLRVAIADSVGTVRQALGGVDPADADASELRALASRLNATAILVDSLAVAEVLATDSVEIPDPVEGETAGQRVRAVREALGLTVEDLADATGLAVSTVRDVEAGRRPRRARVAALIAEALEAASFGAVGRESLQALIVDDWAQAGLLAPPGDWPGQDDLWLASRRRRRLDGATVRRRAQMRAAYVLSLELGQR